ncbi:MAG TPA: CHAD domain-containing protein [Methylovirgula sp.]|nr:CHAD domain-containing protein [Methylovirgula sp.]
MQHDREIELKFLFEPDALPALQDTPPLSEASLEAREQLRTTYFDTPGHKLKQEGVAVRIRQAGNRLLQSVKQGNGISRGEWEHEIDRPVPDASFVRDRGVQSLMSKNAEALRPIFETNVNRTSLLWQNDGAKIEFALDAGEIKANGHCLAISELELELKEGSPAQLFGLAQSLVARAPLALSLVSKAERGFLLAEGKWGVGAKASTPELERGMPAGEAFEAICLTCLRAFMLNYAMFSEATQDVELVHQARIAIRRLRAALTFFKPIARDADYDALRGELKWISDLLGSARDLDVWQSQTLKPKAAEPGETGVQSLVDHVEEKRREAHAQLRKALSSSRLREMLLNFAIWLESDSRHLALKDSTRPIERFLDKNLGKRLDKLVERGGRLDEMNEKDQHRLRIRAKKLRYTAEFFESLVEGEKDRKAFKNVVGALEDMQSSLGEIHDFVALSSFLAEEFGRPGQLRERPQQVPAAFAAGAVSQADVPRKKLLKEAQDAYEKLSDWRKFWR